MQNDVKSCNIDMNFTAFHSEALKFQYALPILEILKEIANHQKAKKNFKTYLFYEIYDISDI